MTPSKMSKFYDASEFQKNVLLFQTIGKHFILASLMVT